MISFHDIKIKLATMNHKQTHYWIDQSIVNEAININNLKNEQTYTAISAVSRSTSTSNQLLNQLKLKYNCKCTRNQWLISKWKYLYQKKKCTKRISKREKIVKTAYRSWWYNRRLRSNSWIKLLSSMNFDWKRLKSKRQFRLSGWFQNWIWQIFSTLCSS